MSLDSAQRGLVADAMLGRLARWLRALGRDVVFDERLDDDALARRAADQNRLLLTRDRRLCADRGSPDWCILVEGERPRAQVTELAETLGLFREGWRDRLFTRCMVCNTPLDQLHHGAASHSAPEEVRRDPRVRSAGFRQCGSCGRVFWEGSHTRRMRRWLEAVAREADRPGAGNLDRPRT